jgi:hypothetical protein
MSGWRKPSSKSTSNLAERLHHSRGLRGRLLLPIDQPIRHEPNNIQRCRNPQRDKHPADLRVFLHGVTNLWHRGTLRDYRRRIGGVARPSSTHLKHGIAESYSLRRRLRDHPAPQGAPPLAVFARVGSQANARSNTRPNLLMPPVRTAPKLCRSGRWPTIDSSRLPTRAPGRLRTLLAAPTPQDLRGG